MTERRDTKAQHSDAGPAAATFKFSALAKFSEKQLEALKAILAYTYVLYGGARGGGKSYFLRWVAIYLALLWGKRCPGVTIGIFCETYPVLRDRIIRKFLRECPKWLGKWNGENKEFTFYEQYGGAVIAFRNLDDPDNYLGVEFAAILVDQIEQHSNSVFTDLMGSLRWPGIERPVFLATANPGGIGHNWVKSYWLDKIFPLEMSPFAKEFEFVRALPSDNEHLTENYWVYLRSQPERRRRAWIDGDWSVFEGQVFAEWEEPVHIIDSFTIPEDWRCSAGLDWGGKKPGWFGCVAFGPEEDGVAYWEYYFREQDAYTVGYSIGLLLNRQPRVPEYIQADAQMWEDGGTGAITLAEQFQRGLNDAMGPLAPALLKAPKGPRSRQIRVDVMHEYLRFERVGKDVKTWSRPKLRFLRHGVPHLIRTLPALPYDKKKPEDVDTKAEDHAYDGLTYLLVSRPAMPGRETARIVPQGMHPGFRDGRRRRRHDDSGEASAERTNNDVRRMHGEVDPETATGGRTGFRAGGGAPLREVDSIHDFS